MLKDELVRHPVLTDQLVRHPVLTGLGRLDAVTHASTAVCAGVAWAAC